MLCISAELNSVDLRFRARVGAISGILAVFPGKSVSGLFDDAE
jgi:hypothetical protein